ncbi:T9SS type A sorting domain-containing protein [bacterium]|nr:T9SS type A sorting domain-containing protein [bacterium]
MKIFKALFIIMMFLLIPFSVYAADSWTIMIYMNGDNNLEPAALDDFLEISSVGSTAGMNIVIQFDRIPGYSPFYGDWLDTRRFYVNKDDTPVNSDSHDSATYNISIGEQNMGDPNTLVEFFTWAVDSYPAERYMLVIWNHGEGWRRSTAPVMRTERSVSDDVTSGDSLYYTTGEIGSAFDLMSSYIGRNIDIAGFDVCLNQMLENAHLLSSYADILVGSEDSEWEDGWSYWYFLEPLALDPAGTDPEELSSLIVEAYANGDNGSNVSNPSITGSTQSALRLEEMPSMVKAFNRFSVLLSHYNVNGYKTEIDNVRGSLSFYPVPPSYGEYSDLGQFVNEIKGIDISPYMNDAADDLLEIMAGTIINTFAASGYVCSGLTVYYPEYTSYSSIYKNTLLAKDTFWDSFLQTVAPFEEYSCTYSSEDEGADGTISIGESFTYTVIIGSEGNFTHETVTIEISSGGDFSYFDTQLFYISDMVPYDTSTLQINTRIKDDYSGFGSEQFQISVTGDFLGQATVFKGYLNVGAPLVLLVDDDSGQADEVPLVESLERLNVNYSVYSISESGNTFPQSLLQDYPVVLWNTGIHAAATLFKKGEMDLVEEHIDSGKGILISSRHLLKMIDAVDSDTTTAFLTDYLGVSSYSKEGFRHEKELRGLFMDPVSQDITLSLSDPSNELSIWDTEPVEEAIELFSDDYDRPIGIRNPRYSSDSSGRMLFLSFPVDKATDTAILDLFIQRSIAWLRGASEELIFQREKILPYPNPAQEMVYFTEIDLGNVIDIYDISGKLLITLPEGPHTWELVNSDGIEVSNGVYIYVVRDGQKIIYKGKIAIVR